MLHYTSLSKHKNFYFVYFQKGGCLKFLKLKAVNFQSIKNIQNIFIFSRNTKKRFSWLKKKSTQPYYYMVIVNK